MERCDWCLGDELYERYHDDEWGVPVTSTQDLFERLALEGMQAGLAWITVLRKREHMRSAFFGFSVDKLSNAQNDTLDRWLGDAGLIRHRGKLTAMVENARIVSGYPDFAEWIWSFAPTGESAHRSLASVPALTDESVAMSKALKKAGFRFVGPTICYAFMQSVGMVNDHVTSCWRHAICAELTAKTRRDFS